MQTQYKVFAVPVDVAFSTSTGQRIVAFTFMSK